MTTNVFKIGDQLKRIADIDSQITLMEAEYRHLEQQLTSLQSTLPPKTDTLQLVRGRVAVIQSELEAQGRLWAYIERRTSAARRITSRRDVLPYSTFDEYFESLGNVS